MASISQLDMDDLEDLFNYDVDAPAIQLSAGLAGDSGRTAATGDDGLGLDEVVQVVSRRKPVPKLDEQLLISEKGVPRLQKIMKKHLRFEGKGHEFSDISRMLNLYQVWLDEMYPRARFEDGLEMIEKVGHSRRMQNARQQWLEEGKPRRKSPGPTDAGPDGMASTTAGADDMIPTTAGPDGIFDSIFGPERPAGPTVSADKTDGSRLEPPTTQPSVDQMIDLDDEDDDSLLAELNGTSATVKTSQQPAPVDGGDNNDVPDDDELMALLDGDGGPVEKPARTTQTDGRHDVEMDLLRDMEMNDMQPYN